MIFECNVIVVNDSHQEKQSSDNFVIDVGISISENVNVFTPASDAILDAAVFNKLPYFLKFSKNAMKIIKMSYCLAILYNIVGISFALTNNLSPLVAAVIMPLSTATIISFVSIMSNFYASKTKWKNLKKILK